MGWQTLTGRSVPAYKTRLNLRLGLVSSIKEELSLRSPEVIPSNSPQTPRLSWREFVVPSAHSKLAEAISHAAHQSDSFSCSCALG